jgi:chromate transporter
MLRKAMSSIMRCRSGAALYNPVWTSSVKTSADFGIALVGFALLTVWRAPPLVVVVVSALGGIALGQAAA